LKYGRGRKSLRGGEIHLSGMMYSIAELVGESDDPSNHFISLIESCALFLKVTFGSVYTTGCAELLLNAHRLNLNVVSSSFRDASHSFQSHSKSDHVPCVRGRHMEMFRGPDFAA
jgi:hypothetical protein